MMVIQKRLICQGNNVIKQKTKTQLVFSISQREIKELYCPVSADESQIKEVRIDLFEHWEVSLILYSIIRALWANSVVSGNSLVSASFYG